MYVKPEERTFQQWEMVDQQQSASSGNQGNNTIVPAGSGINVLKNGSFESPNYKKGQVGWRVDSYGESEFNGGVSTSLINIPDTVTANSFHVDSQGNAWWGSTALATALASILKTGIATFGTGSNAITIDGTTGQIYSTSGTWTLSGDGTNNVNDYVVNANELVGSWHTLELPSFDSAVWTFSGVLLNYVNGSRLSANGGITLVSTNAIADFFTGGSDATITFALSRTYKIKFTTRSIAPSGTNILSALWTFIGFATGASTANGDITSTSVKRIGFCFYNGNLYGVCCDGTTITASSSIETVTTEENKNLSIIVENGVSAKFYVEGVLSATISTNLPTTGGTYIVADGVNGNGGGAGFEFVSNIILSQKLT